MGVDVYLHWNDMTEKDKEKQYTGFIDAGKYGYLRGAYFGGHSDVLRFLFDWMDWEEETFFNPEKFEQKLILLEHSNGNRPDKGKWDYTKGADRGWDFSERQNTDIDKETMLEYRDFLELGKKLIQENKNPIVYISY